MPTLPTNGNIPDKLRVLIPSDILSRYSLYSYGHAIDILMWSFPDEWSDIVHALKQFKLTNEDLTVGGGNESAIPKKFDEVLYPAGWREIKITGDLIVHKYHRLNSMSSRTFDPEPSETKEIKGFIDGHNIDFIKGKVAFDLEWNSKDQTFDRDLLAMRTYFGCGVIDVGIIITRDRSLNRVFGTLTDKNNKPLLSKYGASTTWLGKLIPRLDSRRNGGCPILAVGITDKCVVDE